MIRLPIFLLFLGSGIAGLVYQVVWTKLLTLVFGVSLLAVSTVLTAFFGGLALGSFLGGRWVDRRGNGFLWYGVAEAAVGVYALIFLPLLSINNAVYAGIAGYISASFTALTLLKFSLSVCLLIIPATLMGATLPILSKSLARARGRFAKDVGGLYAVNTIGAIIGAVATAFVFIPALGLKTIIIAAGVFNILIGGAAILIGRMDKADGAADENAPQPRAKAGVGDVPGPFARLIVWGFALSGFTALVYEVIWTRIMGFLLTGTVYAFAAVLAVFLTGIAGGSLVFSRFTDRVRSKGTLIIVLAAVEALIGVSSIALITLYDRLPSMDFYSRVSTPVWSEFVLVNFLTCFVTLILPAFLFGATFPLVCKLYAGADKRTGSRIGNIYSVNTVGGIIGSFAAGFILIPAIGMQKTIILMGMINAGIGMLFVIRSPFAGLKTKYAFLAVSAIAVGAASFTLPENMPLAIHKGFLKTGEDIVFYKEGPAATVMIAERTGKGLAASNKRLWVNGNRATAAYYEGLQINRFQGVLPMVIHPGPKDVLVICFGSGTTFGTLSQFPVRRVDNVEIASTVIEGAPFFKKENADVLHNPVSRITIDDGRSYLSATAKKYDVITEEPMHPALSGVVNLYTREYYELARAHLKPGGVMSQWIPLYNVSVEDMRMLVATFQSVFPHTTVWLANADIFMIGSPERTEIDLERLTERLAMPNVAALLKDIDLEDPYEFLNTFLMNEDMTRAYAQGAPVMTDDMPTVEFTGPKSLNVNTISPNIAEFLKYREPLVPYLAVPARFNRSAVLGGLERKYAAGRYNLVGRAYFADKNYPAAAEWFRAALQIDPGNRNSLHYKQIILF
ncbi:MAG: fused MFS/spermidine synthase [Deltaproteobacteria bacterium]|nr:fused MFS/spermidine synthase [Deltaproteobacteria bacterium]